jgi:hypothetical protein
VEAANTDPRIRTSQGGKFFYWESFYHDVYLNKSNLMGSWIGREGKGVQAWSTYWFSATTNLQFQYRNQKIAKDFINGGGTLNSWATKATVRLLPDMELIGLLQYDRWKVPVLAPGLQSNLTTSVQFTFWPKNLKAVSHPQP